MSVIHIEDHKKIVRGIRRRYRKAILALILACLVLAVSPTLLKLDMDLVREGYRTGKAQFSVAMMKLELLQVLRTKPLSAGQALDLVDIVMGQADVPIPLILAVVSQESEFRVNAISNKGAKGIMQTIPATFKAFSSHPLLGNPRNIHDMQENLRAGISYLTFLKGKLGDWTRVLRAYQAGEKNADNREFDWYSRAVLARAERYER